MSAFGATAAEWAAAKRLAKRDLLPVVSNPHVVLGKFSKMKELGKTPSQVIETADGPRAIGFSDWTAFEATVKNIEAWQLVPDHGVCIQTRLLRAIDIDTDDEEQADKIEAFFTKRLGPAPARERAGSARRILVYRVAGEVRRASFPVNEWVDEETGKTKRELVELLGDGQQFVAAGMHKSGQRYEWRGGFPKPDDVQDVDQEDLEAAFQAAHEKFACGDLRQAGRRDPTLPEDLDVDDPVAEHLVANWPSYSCEHGKLYIECPAKELHSSDNGETESAWMLAGTGSYRNGHFVCLHQSCKEALPTDDAFFRAVGYKAAKAEDFEDLSVGQDAAAAYVALAPGASAKSKELKALAQLPLPGFNRDGQGKIETSLENICRALRAPQAAKCWLAWDEFLSDLMIAEAPEEWRPFTDADAVELRIRLEALGFKNAIGKDLMRDALVKIAADQRFDSAVKWLRDVVPPWDGESRIVRFWPTYMNTEDSPYTRALGLYTWTAQAARVLDPGCKVDMVPVLVSPEGYMKSTALMSMAPAVDFFTSFRVEDKDNELSRLMRGCLVGELEELRGIGVRDGEWIKAWITKRFEKWTQKYQERTTTMPRRLVFYGTTNDDDFLSAHMGERRWLPVHILRKINHRLVERDMLQLWAEARAIYDIDGIMWEEVERLARDERDAFKSEDEWEAKVAAWLDDNQDIEDGRTPREAGVRGDQVLVECIGLDGRTLKKADQQRIGKVLTGLGMKRTQVKLSGRNTKLWVDQKGGIQLGIQLPARGLQTAESGAGR